MPILDLDLIADRHSPTSRAYLTYLGRSGFGVRKVLLVDFAGTEAPPADAQFRDFCEALQEGQPCRVEYFEPFRFEDHATEIETLAATGFGDAGFQNALRRQKTAAFLYTDGGRVPPELLGKDGLRIFHVHPGVVPEVRGSDCLLWSLATRGRPGASCFYMDAGIDTGPLIRTMEFRAPSFPRLARHFDQQWALLHRALLHSYDPHLRAQVFLEVARSPGGIDTAPAAPQAAGSGRSFFWMHPVLKRKVLRERVFA